MTVHTELEQFKPGFSYQLLVLDEKYLNGLWLLERIDGEGIYADYHFRCERTGASADIQGSQLEAGVTTDIPAAVYYDATNNLFWMPAPGEGPIEELPMSDKFFNEWISRADEFPTHPLKTNKRAEQATKGTPPPPTTTPPNIWPPHLGGPDPTPATSIPEISAELHISTKESTKQVGALDDVLTEAEQHAILAQACNVVVRQNTQASDIVHMLAICGFVLEKGYVPTAAMRTYLNLREGTTDESPACAVDRIGTSGQIYIKDDEDGDCSYLGPESAMHLRRWLLSDRISTWIEDWQDKQKTEQQNRLRKKVADVATFKTELAELLVEINGGSPDDHVREVWELIANAGQEQTASMAREWRDRNETI